LNKLFMISIFLLQGEDIMVGRTDPLYGGQPYTEQSRPCGHPGHRIRFPESFFTDWNGTRAAWGGRPGKVLAREWAKLRYGVFDEHGYAGDPLYPVYHQVGDLVLPTATTNAMVRGHWIYGNGTRACDPTEEAGACFFQPEGPNEPLNCSLGYLAGLASVRGWCEPAQLASQPLSPTKHNVLCGGRPLLEVIRSHPDFPVAAGAGIPGGEAAASSILGHELRETEFDLVRQPPPEYVILVETSSGMAGVWKWVRKALQNLVRFEMADNARVAIVTFAKEARLEQNLAVLTSERVRIRVADAIPDSPKKLSRYEDRCVSCAIKTAMDEVLRNREAGGHLIIISQGDAATLSASEAAMVAEYDKYYNVRISSVLVPQRKTGGGRDVTLSFYAEIAARSGGRSLTLTDTGAGLALLSDLILSLREVVSVDSAVLVTVHSHESVRPEGTVTTEGQFLIDSTLGRETRFGVFVDDDEDHRIKAIRFLDAETGKAFGPYTKMSSDYDIINYKTINFGGPGDQPPFEEVGFLNIYIFAILVKKTYMGLVFYLTAYRNFTIFQWI
jgi:hypothetical protein